MKWIVAAIALMVMTDPALSQNLTCDRLYYLRNEFYNAKGLCFTRRGAIERFPENPSTCRYRASEDLPMSAKDHQAMEAIRESEIRFGCRRK